eukprot:gene5734-11067_t
MRGAPPSAPFAELELRLRLFKEDLDHMRSEAAKCEVEVAASRARMDLSKSS